MLLPSLREEGIDYSTANGRVVAGICAALAAYKRELMHERASAARAAGRVRCGTPAGPRSSPLAKLARCGRCAPRES